MGDFRVVKVGNQLTKNGGNVASHFLTADGRVIHSVTGPVSADVLLDEARWAIEMYAQAKTKSPSEQTQFVAWSHQQASWAPASSRDRRVHELLAAWPMPPLQSVYEEIFGKILGERVSQAGPRLAQASMRLQYAEKTNRPILFVLHEGHQFWLGTECAPSQERAGLEVAVLDEVLTWTRIDVDLSTANLTLPELAAAVNCQEREEAVLGWLTVTHSLEDHAKHKGI